MLKYSDQLLSTATKIDFINEIYELVTKRELEWIYHNIIYIKCKHFILGIPYLDA